MNGTLPPWRSSASATAATATNNYAATASPAYIPVQARRSLQPQAEQPQQSPSAPPAAPPQPAPERKRIEWPPAVRAYVQRSFAPESQIDGVSREELEQKLKEVITESAKQNTLETLDWDRMPLPQVMIQNERNRILMSSSVGGAYDSTGFGSVARKEPAATTTARKRKSTDAPPSAEGSPPWRKTNHRNQFEDRVNQTTPDKRQRIEFNSFKPESKSEEELERRRKRFESVPIPPRSESPAPSATHGPIVGRCQELEKRYFRLTAPPNPDTVRPLPVLQKTLELLKKKWRKDNNYGYICDQFKSLRQDLTVQHIRNEFTVTVYEIHARIALEKGDLGEYNQCQTQLRALYERNLGGHPMEFKAYRILYFIYTRNQAAINDVLTDLTPAEKADPAVRHALEVRSALALGNYHRFFQLYLDTPNMGAYLMDMFVDRERLAALAAICKAYKPDVNIRFITEELGFESDEQSARFVLEHGSEQLLEEKDGQVKLLTGKAGGIFEQAKREAFKVIDIKGQI
ncbi:hypothetical protein VTN49DRAFT_126 [Thermomyces lanuginosus]|uniref:uncharacterized protein n=1 Tax=Thermomyces lanuginosus TaxID=5541 RepID=UPI003743EC60